MVLVSTFVQTRKSEVTSSMKDIGKIIKEMGTGSASITMEISTLETGKQVKEMVKVIISI